MDDFNEDSNMNNEEEPQNNKEIPETENAGLNDEEESDSFQDGWRAYQEFMWVPPRPEDEVPQDFLESQNTSESHHPFQSHVAEPVPHSEFQLTAEDRPPSQFHVAEPLLPPEFQNMVGTPTRFQFQDLLEPSAEFENTDQPSLRPPEDDLYRDPSTLSPEPSKSARNPENMDLSQNNGSEDPHQRDPPNIHSLVSGLSSIGITSRPFPPFTQNPDSSCGSSGFQMNPARSLGEHTSSNIGSEEVSSQPSLDNIGTQTSQPLENDDISHFGTYPEHSARSRGRKMRGRGSRSYGRSYRGRARGAERDAEGEIKRGSRGPQRGRGGRPRLQRGGMEMEILHTLQMMQLHMALLTAQSNRAEGNNTNQEQRSGSVGGPFFQPQVAGIQPLHLHMNRGHQTQINGRNSSRCGRGNHLNGHVEMGYNGGCESGDGAGANDGGAAWGNGGGAAAGGNVGGAAAWANDGGAAWGNGGGAAAWGNGGGAAAWSNVGGGAAMAGEGAAWANGGGAAWGNGAVIAGRGGNSGAAIAGGGAAWGNVGGAAGDGEAAGAIGEATSVEVTGRNPREAILGTDSGYDTPPVAGAEDLQFSPPFINDDPEIIPLIVLCSKFKDHPRSVIEKYFGVREGTDRVAKATIGTTVFVIKNVVEGKVDETLERLCATIFDGAKVTARLYEKKWPYKLPKISTDHE